MKELIPLGIVIILIGFIVVIIGSLSSMKTSDTKVAVGGFIGFIPFGFANDKGLLKVVIGLSVAVFIFWILFYIWR